MFATEFKKWWATFQVAWANHLVYKLNFFLLVLGPPLVFFFVKYNVWSAIYAMPGVDEITGYQRGDMLKYQALVLLISLIAQGHTSMQLGEDIRLGRISAYLIYPFDFWKFHGASFLAFQAIQSLIVGLSLSFLVALGIVDHFDPLHWLWGYLYCLCVSIHWFILQFCIGLFAFWLEESWTLRVMFMMVAQFLSGALIPLEMFPQGLRTVLDYTPFPYLTYVPVQWFMGQYHGSLPFAFLILSVWILLTYLLSRWIWQRGLKMYTAAGI